MAETKPDKPKRPPFHVEFAEKVIAHLEAGTAPWQRPWHPGKTSEVPHNPASGTVYRGNRVTAVDAPIGTPAAFVKVGDPTGKSIITAMKKANLYRR